MFEYKNYKNLGLTYGAITVLFENIDESRIEEALKKMIDASIADGDEFGSKIYTQALENVKQLKNS